MQLHNTCAYTYCQLLLWLTLNLPNLCVSVYTYLRTPRMAHAPLRICRRVCVCAGRVAAWCGHDVGVSGQCVSHVSYTGCKTGWFLRIGNCYGISCHASQHMWGSNMAGWCKNCSADAHNLLPNTLPHIGVVAVQPRTLLLPRVCARVLRTNFGITCYSCSRVWNGVGRGWRDAHALAHKRPAPNTSLFCYGLHDNISPFRVREILSLCKPSKEEK